MEDQIAKQNQQPNQSDADATQQQKQQVLVEQKSQDRQVNAESEIAKQKLLEQDSRLQQH